MRGAWHGGLFHATDWLPTLVSGFHGRPDALPPGIDGIDLWRALVALLTHFTERTEPLLGRLRQQSVHRGWAA